MNYPRKIKKEIKKIGMVEIRPYLTAIEIDSILEKIQTEVSDYALRKMMLYSVVMSICTDIPDFAKDEIDINVIEPFYYNGIFDEIVGYIKGFDILLEGFDNLAVTDIYKRFELILEDFTKQFKNIDIEKSINDFENKLNELKEVNKEKELILNG